MKKSSKGSYLKPADIIQLKHLKAVEANHSISLHHAKMKELAGALHTHHVKMAKLVKVVGHIKQNRNHALDRLDADNTHDSLPSTDGDLEAMKSEIILIHAKAAEAKKSIIRHHAKMKQLKEHIIHQHVQMAQLKRAVIAHHGQVAAAVRLSIANQLEVNN